MALSAFAAETVAMRSWSPSRASEEVSVHLAADAACRTPPLTWLIGCCPEVPAGQWMLSLPSALHYRMAYDRELPSAALGLFIRGVVGRLACYRHLEFPHGSEELRDVLHISVEPVHRRQSPNHRVNDFNGLLGAPEGMRTPTLRLPHRDRDIGSELIRCGETW